MKKQYFFFNSRAALILIVVLFVPYWIEAGTAGSVTCTVSPIITVCGNEIVEAGEQCDSTNLAGQNCEGLGYYGGTLRCVDCNFDASGCTSRPPTGPGGIWIRPPFESKVIIKGMAYPYADITLLSDGEIKGKIRADSLGNFKFEITNIAPGICTFSLWAVDSEGRKSIPFSLTAHITKEVITTISGILLSPTLELKKSELKKGETLDILGQTAPESEVGILVIFAGQETLKKTKAGPDGQWFYSLDTTTLEEGIYYVKAKATSPDGLISLFSQSLSFYLERARIEEIYPEGDFNQDGRVNLVDFSILLHWWGTDNKCCDQNLDGKVDLVDFSIMLYWWTG